MALLKHRVMFGCLYPLSAEILFSDLSPQTRKSLASITQSKKFRKGASIFKTGGLPDSIFILVQGQARLSFFDESNDWTFIRLVKPDEILGLTQMIAVQVYKTSLEAITPCLCKIISYEDFVRFLRDEPKISFRLLRELGLNLRKSRELFINMNL